MNTNSDSNEDCELATGGARSLPPLLRRAWYHMTQAFRRRLVDLDLTPHQFTVLRWLHETDGGEPVTQRRLAELMASDPNTVTSVLSRMEEADLIERRSHAEDRRAKNLLLRPKGRAVYKKAAKIAEQLKSQVGEVIAPERREAFLEDLEKIAEAAQRAWEDS